MDVQETIKETAAFSGRGLVFEPPEAFRKRAFINSMEQYRELYERSIKDPEGFWREQAQRITWFEPFHTVKNTSYDPSNLYIRWFEGGKLNAAYNCIDRHLEKRADQVAFYWEPDDPNEESKAITYRQLYEEVCRLANVLKKHGVKKGDRVTIYLPMIP